MIIGDFIQSKNKCDMTEMCCRTSVSATRPKRRINKTVLFMCERLNQYNIILLVLIYAIMFS